MTAIYSEAHPDFAWIEEPKPTSTKPAEPAGNKLLLPVTGFLGGSYVPGVLVLAAVIASVAFFIRRRRMDGDKADGKSGA